MQFLVTSGYMAILEGVMSAICQLGVFLSKPNCTPINSTTVGVSQVMRYKTRRNHDMAMGQNRGTLPPKYGTIGFDPYPYGIVMRNRWDDPWDDPWDIKNMGWMSVPEFLCTLPKIVAGWSTSWFWGVQYAVFFNRFLVWFLQVVCPLDDLVPWLSSSTLLGNTTFGDG